MRNPENLHKQKRTKTTSHDLIQDLMRNRKEFIQCPICEKQALFFTWGDILSEGSRIIVPIFYCRGCNTFIKKIKDDIIASYFDHSIYTDFNYENEAYNYRIQFFRYIYTFTKRWNNQIGRWLDFGCSYGHFVAFINSMNINSYGIEISDNARLLGNSRGLKIFKKIEELPKDLTFDVISFIDSLYYISEPKQLLIKVRSLLVKNGLLVLRDTNRNWLVKFNKYFRHNRNCTALIDHIIGYSKKSLQWLLITSGFEILEITFHEKGKYRSPGDKILYEGAKLIYILTFGLINFMPGLIIIARKSPN